jgi:hypothetical protein
MKLEYIFNIIYCFYVKNYFILKLAFSLLTFYIYFIMFSF